MMISANSIRENLFQRIEQLRNLDWFEKPVHLPDAEVFRKLVDVAFNASLMTEEKRRPGFRLLYCSPKDLEPDAQLRFLPNRFRAIALQASRPLTAQELSRIAPAADLTRFLVCVYPESKNNSLHIWGLLDVGDNWWRFVHHEASSGTPPPNFLTITSSAPGELSFSVQGDILLVLKHGTLSHPIRSPIGSGPISEFLEPTRKCLYDQARQELSSEKWDSEGHDDDYPSRFYNFFLERILSNIRYLGHGGTIVIVPQEISFDDPRLSDRILLKYAAGYDYAWSSLVRSLVNSRRYYDLFFPLHGGKKKLTRKALAEFPRLEAEKESIDEEIQDIAKSIASLASVDGALAITTKFRVLGFGGEIFVASPALRYVTEISEISDDKRRTPIQSFGTRHRSAFRFCSSFEDSVSFIVSSDGGVKAAKRHGKELLFWPDINEGAMGL